jgi:hypothetical protein
MEKQIEDLRRRIAELEREMGLAVEGVSGHTLWQREMDHEPRVEAIIGTFRQDLRKAEERLRRN